MNSRISTTLMLLIGAGVLILASGLVYWGAVVHPMQLREQQATATAQVYANAAASAQAQANATATAEASIYTQATQGTSDISDPLTTPDNYGWAHVANQGDKCDFVDGTYHAQAPVGYFEHCNASATNFTDCALQVEMTIISGDAAGLLFRLHSTQNSEAYYFFIHPDGRYDLVKKIFNAKGNTYDDAALVGGRSLAIHQGLNQANLVSDTSGTEASFRNLQVWQL
jgi:hypothetical protein